MKTKVNICTEDWCNLVFEGKNKEYGAFAIRTHAAQEKVKSIFITIFFAISIAAMPLIKKHITPPTIDLGKSTPTVFTPVTVDPPKPINVSTPPAPRPMKPMVRFTIPTIGADETPSEILTNDDALNKKFRIGTEFIGGDENADPTGFDEGLTGGGTKTKIFTICEKMPQYKGGIEAMKNFLKKNLRYPEAAKDNEIAGKVFVQFVVNEVGEIKDIKILRGLDDSCNEEAKRILSLMPAWYPGMQNGKPVAVYFTLPITFSLGHNN